MELLRAFFLAGWIDFGGGEGDDFVFEDKGVKEFCGTAEGGFAQSAANFESSLLGFPNSPEETPVIGDGLYFD